MAGGNGQIRLHWTLADYESEGRADGILRQSLTRLIDQLKRGDREPAWEVLAALVEHGKETASFDSMADYLKPYGIRPENLKRLLESLEEIHLIDIRDERYYLASESMRPRIQQWIQAQNVVVQARQEARRQLRQLRNSALRGMFGGALGFVLFDMLIYTADWIDLSYVIFFLTQVLAIGGIAGFLVTLTVDLSIASYHGSRQPLRYLVGGLGGLLAFSVGLLLYINNEYMGDTLIKILPAATLEGALWGVVIGLGTTYALSGTRKVWLTVLVTALAGGLILLGGELLGSRLFHVSVLIKNAFPSALQILLAKLSPALPVALANVHSALWVFLGGVVVPFFYMVAALFGRTDLEKGGNR
jgi:hypothetical protein